MTDTQNKAYSNGVVLGGILSAATLVITAAAQGLGMLDVILYLGVTPIAIAAVKKGAGFGLAVSAVSFILVSIFLGVFPSGAYFAATVIPPGLALGSMIGAGRKDSETVTVLSAVMFLTTAAAIWMSSAITGISLTDDVNASIKFAMKTGEALFGTTSVTEESLLRAFYSTAPFVVAGVAVCYSFYLWLFNRWLLSRLGMTAEFNVGAGIRDLLSLPAWLAHVLPILLLLPPCLTWSGMDLVIEVNGIRIGVFGPLFMDAALILALMFFAKGIFAVRDLIFTKVSGIGARILIVALLITILAPATAILGWYICLTSATPRITSSKSPNPLVSPDKVSLELLRPKASGNDGAAEKGKGGAKKQKQHFGRKK